MTKAKVNDSFGAKLGLALVCVLAHGCSDANPSFYVQGQLLPQEDDGVCSYGGDTGFLLRGIYNVDFGGTYTLFPQYNNTARILATDFSADTSGIQVQGAEVSIQSAAGQLVPIAEGPNPFTIPTFSFVPASIDGITPGQASGAIPVIPGAYSPSLIANNTYVIEVTVFGETVGGISVEAAPFTWVVEACGGTCLFDCFTPPADGGPLCSLGQDFSVGALGQPPCI